MEDPETYDVEEEEEVEVEESDRTADPNVEDEPRIEHNLQCSNEMSNGQASSHVVLQVNSSSNGEISEEFAVEPEEENAGNGKCSTEMGNGQASSLVVLQVNASSNGVISEDFTMEPEEESAGDRQCSIKISNGRASSHVVLQVNALSNGEISEEFTVEPVGENAGEGTILNGQDPSYHVVPPNRIAGSSPEMHMQMRYYIHRVPSRMRVVDERAYTPGVVSIGPYHYGNSGLKAGEAFKKRFLGKLLNGDSYGSDNLEKLRVAMMEREAETRQCYAEEFGEISSDEFIMMMLLDGCFVVELLRLCGRSSRQGRNVDNDYIFETRWMLRDLRCDLLIQENQLPLFVLDTIYSLTGSSSQEECTLNELALKFFEPLRPGKEANPPEKLQPKRNCPHLLALFHSSFISSDDQGSSRRPRPPKSNRANPLSIPSKIWVGSAKILCNSGIRLTKKSGRPLDISFKWSKLAIPTLPIDENTSFVLGNLAAYEQCGSHVKPYFSSLAVFFANISTTADDVLILRRLGIIHNAQGSNQEVVDFFNGLAKELVFDSDDCYIFRQVVDIYNYSQSFWCGLCFGFIPFLRRINFVKLVLSYVALFLTVHYTGFRIRL